MTSDPQTSVVDAPAAVPAAATTEAPKRELRIDADALALVEIQKLHQKRLAEGKAPALGLRIGLRGGGCDGFSYLFEWADKPPGPKDSVFRFAAPDGEAVTIFVDKKSLLYLTGTTLTFFKGLMGHGFKFENPNVKGACGCGDSVHF